MVIFNIRRAFTLLEIMVVVIIIGILATLGTVSYARISESTKEKEARANLELIYSAERIRRMEDNTNQYIDCTCNSAADCIAATGCNTLLRLELVNNNWNYAAQADEAADPSTFVATATRNSGNNLNETITLNNNHTWGGNFTP